MIALPPKVEEAAKKADERLNKRLGYKADNIQGHLDTLTRFGKTEVGWRESCGKTDPTMFMKREWDKIVKALARSGITLTTETVKHANGSPTRAGGFWKSEVYRMEGGAK